MKICNNCRLLFGVIGALAAFFAIWKYGNCDYPGGDCPANIHDALEAFGALATAVAFLVTLHAIKLQRDDLDKQNKFMRIQAFENSFFNLLRLHNDIVEKAEVVTNDFDFNQRPRAEDGFVRNKEKFIGRTAFKKLADMLLENQGYEEEVYIALYESYEYVLGHYFRNVYRVVKYINDSELPDTEKKDYVAVLRAQLSSAELVLLFFNCISPNGREKFKPLVEKYSLFEQINKKQLAMVLLEKYDKGAYGEASA